MKILEKDPPLAQEFTRPWIVVSFLYPISSAGLMHIFLFTFVPTLLIVLEKYILRYIIFGSLAFLAAFMLFIGYGIYYLTFCVFDSSKANQRAQQIPDIYWPDKWELLWQYLLILSCFAICFWPAAVYYIYFRGFDLQFLVLTGFGLFFFPMALLSGILFYAIHALNPVFIITSIFKTFVGYIKLFLFFCIVSVPAIFIFVRLKIPAFLVHGIIFYLLIVLANRLGWFYWWYKDKLGWGI